MSSTAQCGPETVFFVGNGVLRVPSEYVDLSGSQMARQPARTPSWDEFTEDLWTQALKLGKPQGMTLSAFLLLDPPRQAEWFDHHVLTARKGLDPADVAALRMGILDRQLYARSGMLTNPLLQELARLVVAQAKQATAPLEIITTNVDLALEQNLAWALNEQYTHAGPVPGINGTVFEQAIVTRNLHEDLVRWCRDPRVVPSHPPLIRIWKIHGCLYDIATSWVGKTLGPELAEVSRECGLSGGLFGSQLPQRALLNCPGEWTSAACRTQQGNTTPAVFAQQEYARLLQGLLSGNQSSPNAVEFRTLLRDRPLVFLGYALHDVDIDVLTVLLLERSSSPAVSRIAIRDLPAREERRLAETERLRQLGVALHGFRLRRSAYLPLPGDRRLGRHEWRFGMAGHTDDKTLLENEWRSRLSQHAAAEWLRAQLEALESMGGSGVGSPAETPGARLVVSGLASVWHAFALRKRGDFPAMRRVSAGLSALDSSVPGGSGLVPVMLAAAGAGPAHVGRMAFLSNAQEEWSSWPQVESFCLSAGIDVRPSPADGSVTGRTSFVLLFETDWSARGARPSGRAAAVPAGRAGDVANFEVTGKSKQRLIMDVDTREAGEDDDPMTAGVPGVSADASGKKERGCLYESLGHRPDHLLFADKLTDRKVLEDWKGPIVYETGSSGIELTKREIIGEGRPNVWTGSLCSFVRTLYRQAFPSLGDSLPEEWTRARKQRGGFKRAYRELAKNPHYMALLELDSEKNRHFVTMANAFGTRLWDNPTDPRAPGGFTHEEEIAYGRELKKKWHDLLEPVMSLLLDSETGELSPGLGALLKENPSSDDPRMRGLGLGVLTTLHEEGLMAYWRLPDSEWQSIVVDIASSWEDLRFRRKETGEEALLPAKGIFNFEVSTRFGEGAKETVEGARVEVNPEELRLSVGDVSWTTRPAPMSARNTLGAGDTVRGMLALGLWLFATEKDPKLRPPSIATVLHAASVLATLKCFSGTFVDFLRRLEELRGKDAWRKLWRQGF